jgi:hypothetical protein
MVERINGVVEVYNNKIKMKIAIIKIRIFLK